MTSPDSSVPAVSPSPAGLPEKLRSQVRVDHESDCWLWTGWINPDGYGLLRYDGRTRRAHRVVYEFFRGRIPEGLVTDHLCRVRHCVRPDHLEPVTRKENTLRGEGAAGAHRRGECMRGHSGATFGPTGKKRDCRECYRERLEHEKARRLEAGRRARENGFATVTHGRSGAYRYGCRCDLCMEWSRRANEGRAERRARQVVTR